MWDPEHVPPSPRAATRQHPPDPLTAILGNATLLGIGYLLARRPRTAALALAATATLVCLTALHPHEPGWRLLLAAWWVVMVVHAWWITLPLPDEDPAPPGERAPRWRGRALAAVCVVLVALSWLRLDTWAITRDAAAAHTDGDCDLALDSLRWLSPAHGLAHDAAHARGARERRSCALLTSALATLHHDEAARLLDQYQSSPGALWEGAGPERAERLLDGVVRGVANARERHGASAGLSEEGTAAVDDAFAQLTTTLRTVPGQDARVREVAHDFLAELDGMSPCGATDIDQWLLDQTWEETALADAVATQADSVPTRMHACAHELTGPERAEVLQGLLTAYPDHALARSSAEDLIGGGAYCEFPVAYPAAPAREGDGPHAMRMSGMDPGEYGFDESWVADSVDEAVLAVCVSEPERGDFQETCWYEGGAYALRDTVQVDFYATEFTVQAYELRTGKLVEDYSAQIGDPCPDVLEYETSFDFDTGPPSEYDSRYSDADLRAVFDRLMD